MDSERDVLAEILEKLTVHLAESMGLSAEQLKNIVKSSLKAHLRELMARLNFLTGLSDRQRGVALQAVKKLHASTHASIDEAEKKFAQEGEISDDHLKAMVTNGAMLFAANSVINTLYFLPCAHGYKSPTECSLCESGIFSDPNMN